MIKNKTQTLAENKQSLCVKKKSLGLLYACMYGIVHTIAYTSCRIDTLQLLRILLYRKYDPYKGKCRVID